MPVTRLTISIDDNTWPKLHISGDRTGAQGERTAFDAKVLYDQAYIQFENILHNQLRPMVEELINRRKQQ